MENKNTKNIFILLICILFPSAIYADWNDITITQDTQISDGDQYVQVFVNSGNDPTTVNVTGGQIGTLFIHDDNDVEVLAVETKGRMSYGKVQCPHCQKVRFVQCSLIKHPRFTGYCKKCLSRHKQENMLGRSFNGVEVLAIESKKGRLHGKVKCPYCRKTRLVPCPQIQKTTFTGYCMKCIKGFRKYRSKSLIGKSFNGVEVLGIEKQEHTLYCKIKCPNCQETRLVSWWHIRQAKFTGYCLKCQGKQ